MFDPPKRKQITSLADIVDPIREAEKKKRRDEMMLVLSKKSGGDATASDRQGQGVGDLASILDMGKSVGKFAAEMAPFSGEVLSGKDAYDQFSTGHPWLGALSTAGAVPGLGMGVRAAKKALGVADKVGDVARVAAKTVRGAKAGAKVGAAPALAKSLGKANAEFNLAKGGDEMVDDAVEAIATEKKGFVGAEMASRDLSPADALARAQGGRHLKAGPEGDFVGAPQGIRDEQSLAAMRAEIDRTIAQGAPARTWYTRTRADIERGAGPRPDLQHTASQNLALHSSQATPETNLGFSITAHNAMETGHPLEISKSGPQSTKFNDARENFTQIDNGPKTGEYENKIDPTADISNTPVNDIWMGRVFGYKAADGGPWEAGFTDAQHAFMDAEMRLAVDRANTTKLGGHSDWDLASAQASPWVYAKGKDLHEKFPKRFPTIEDGFNEANKTYGDYYNKHALNVTHEQVPGAGTGHLTGLTDAPHDVRAKYSADPRAQWIDGDGRDKLHDAVGFWQDTARPSTGTYTNSAGQLETNPGTVSRPLIGIDNNAGPERRIDASSREMAKATEATRGFFDGQEAAASHKLFPANATGRATSFSVPHDGPLSPEQARKLSGTLDNAEFYMADTGNGVSAISKEVYGPQKSGLQLRKDLLGGLGRQIEQALPKAQGGIMQGVSDGTYYDTGLADFAPGSGGATTQMFETLDQTPFLRDRIGADDAVREKVLGNVDRDIEMAQAMRLPIREDLQNARRIFAQGGFEGLRAALKAGVVALPAAAMILKREHEPAAGQAASPSPRGS